MDQLLTGKDKIQKICDSIRKETLEPAQYEAEKIIDDAKKRAEILINEAQKKIESMFTQAKSDIEKERTVFQSSLDQSVQLSLEFLKQEVFQIFNNELNTLINEKTSEKSSISRIIEVITNAIEKEGLKTDIEVIIPKSVPPEDIITEISKKMHSKLSKDSIKIGNFEGGAEIKLIDNKMSLDLTNESLQELLSNYVRKDFRKIVFSK